MELNSNNFRGFFVFVYLLLALCGEVLLWIKTCCQYLPLFGSKFLSVMYTNNLFCLLDFFCGKDIGVGVLFLLRVEDDADEAAAGDGVKNIGLRGGVLLYFSSTQEKNVYHGALLFFAQYTRYFFQRNTSSEINYNRSFRGQPSG